MMRYGSVFEICVVVLISACICLPAMAQDDQMLWPPRSQGMRELVNAEFVGAFDMSREYSFERTVPNTLVEHFSHSLDAQAPEGGSRIFDFMHVVPFTQGSHFWTSTHLGFDQSGTSGTLTASEGTAAGCCAVTGPGAGYGSIVNTGLNAEIIQGGIHADTRMDPGMMAYDVSASGVAQVSTAAAATTASGNATGITSEQSYNQSITVAGEIQNFTYSARLGSGCNASLPCGAWH